MPRKALEPVQEVIGLVAAEDVERFDRAVPDAHFALPAHPTVKQQLIYFSRYADTRGDPLYLRLWHSAQALITDWECDVLPDPRADLDQITSPEATTVIMWVGNAVMTHMNDLETLPKV